MRCNKCISIEEIEKELEKIIEYVKPYVKKGQRLIIQKHYPDMTYVILIYGWEEDEDEVL